MWYWAVAMDSLCGKEGERDRETHAEREREPFFFLQTLEVSLTFSTQAQRQRSPPVKPTYTYAPTHTHTHTNTCHSAENSRKQFRLLDTHKQENTETFFSLFFNRRKGMQVLFLQTTRYTHKDNNAKRGKNHDRWSFLNHLAVFYSLSHALVTDRVYSCVMKVRKQKPVWSLRARGCIAQQMCMLADTARVSLHLDLFCTQRWASFYELSENSSSLSWTYWSFFFKILLKKIVHYVLSIKYWALKKLNDYLYNHV